MVAGMFGLGGPEFLFMLLLFMIAVPVGIVVLIVKAFNRPKGFSRFCPKCGRGVPQEAGVSFCSFCGNALP